MRLLNPTENEVKIGVKGIEYQVAPKGISKDLPQDVYERWLEVHQFLIPVTDEEIASTKEVASEVEQKVEEIKKMAKKPVEPTK